ncbi:site-specific integrase [Arthrobacter castelli]|uniref:site-specific integrase n=1 Tax=Arthrobacter castelli TaxID=271431 RepID=UPI00041FDB37|nr:site-specific integrase [Arthrobacter castelli]
MRARSNHARRLQKIAERCTITADGRACKAPVSHHGLCYHHYHAWQKRRSSAGGDYPLEKYRDSARGAFPKGKQCTLPGCRTEEWRFEKKICLSHHFQWKRLKRQGITFEQFSSTRRPVIGQWSTTEFTLSDLPPILRHEFLLTLQQRDQDGYRLDPWVIRRCITIALEDRVLTMEKLHRAMKERATDQRLQQGLTNYGRMWSARWRYQYTGHDMKSDDIWDAAVLMLRTRSGSDTISSKGILDFRPIRIPWLREAAKETAAVFELPADKIRELIRSCSIASDALLQRPHGATPERLTRADAKAVFNAYSTLETDDDVPKADRYKYVNFHQFRRFLHEGRELKALQSLAPAFRFLATDTLPHGRKTNTVNKSIPDDVIKVLDANLDLLTVAEDHPYTNRRPAELYNHMHQTIYQLLRDLGRRPSEILGLKRDALQHYDDSRPFIRYDAPKTADIGLELPVHQSTADIITAWVDRLETVSDIEPKAAGLMFPSLSGFGPAATRPITISGYYAVYWRWIDRIRNLPEYAQDSGGVARTFDRSRLNLYAWRHTYAQRLSDNNTAPDVIQELMNHKKFETSAGYIRINRQRKADAIRIVDQTTIDRHGAAQDPHSYPAYVRGSVATPLGLCTEPSNVKAGGQACPARSKCGGCTFFRANVSHLPLIDAHIVALTTDLELARPIADTWVVESLTAEIASYRKIRRLLADTKIRLSPTEQSEIDRATELLHALSTTPTAEPIAAVPQKLLPLTPK